MERSPASEAGDNKIRQLELEVLSLQRKLGALHNSDTVAYRRAYNTLCQHAQALKQETESLGGTISGLDLEPFSQAVIEEELGALSMTTLATYLADRVIKQLQDSRELRGALWALSATYLGWRLTFRFARKLKERIQANKERKYRLESSWQTIEARVEAMSSLADYEPAPTEEDYTVERPPDVPDFVDSLDNTKVNRHHLGSLSEAAAARVQEISAQAAKKAKSR